MPPVTLPMPSQDPESPPVSYAPLPSSDQPESAPPRRRLALLSVALSATLLLTLAAVLSYAGTVSGVRLSPNPNPVPDPIAVNAWVQAGMSVGSAAGRLGEGSGSDPYPWTNNMLSWQRTGFHFQPEKNWMNDPNGPMYYNGWYHFFYQYNPEGAVWGNIAWGHAVSKDLLNWVHLPVAMYPDRWYEDDGVWTGSATILRDGQVVMLYTGRVNGTTQVQNVAVPSNLSDPLLLEWTKLDAINPVILPPPGVGLLDFRDPSTAW